MATAQPQPRVLDALAEFAVGASVQGHEVREKRLALHLADAVLARLAGAASSEGQALYRFHERTAAGRLGRVAADASVMRLTEIDDIHRATCVTVGALVTPVALAFCEQDCTRARMFDALFVGQELALRLSAAMGGARLILRGLWPSFLVAPLGAAATLGRLLGLPHAQMRQALALAISQTPRVPGKFNGARSGRWLLFGEAVRQGCVAALAAADGMEGDPALLDAHWLQAVGAELADITRLTAAEVLSDGLSIKPHPSAKQALCALHGLQQLMADPRFAPERIETVEVHVPPAYAPMLDRDPPRTNRLASLVSAPWQMALAAFQPTLLDDVARDAWPEDPRLPAFAARVRVVADLELDMLYPASYPARLVVRTADAQQEVLVRESPGDPALAFDAALLIDKARRMLGAGSPGLETVRLALQWPAQDTVPPALLRGTAASL